MPRLSKILLLIIWLSSYLTISFTSPAPASAQLNGQSSCPENYVYDDNSCIPFTYSSICQTATPIICNDNKILNLITNVETCANLVSTNCTQFGTDTGLSSIVKSGVFATAVCTPLSVVAARLSKSDQNKILLTGKIFAACTPALTGAIEGLKSLARNVRTNPVCTDGNTWSPATGVCRGGLKPDGAACTLSEQDTNISCKSSKGCIDNRCAGADAATLYQQLRPDDPRCPGGIKTSLGCLKTNPNAFLQDFFKWAISLAGISAFLLLGYGAFLQITSAGNPDQLQKAKEIIVAVIAGLLLIVFAIVIIQIFAGDILGLPGFNKTLFAPRAPGELPRGEDGFL